MSKIEKVKLENGLTIYFYKDARRQSTFVSLVTKFGGLHHDFTLEGRECHILSGVAHFLEHYLLEHTTYGNLMDLFGKMHLASNGVTSLVKTEYYFSGVVNIEKALEMLIYALHTISFTKEEVEETKKAIYEEIRMGNDNKGRRLFEMQNECLFKEIPYRNTIGTKEEVEKIDVSLSKKCYEAFYRPENEFIFIAGNFDKEKILEQISSCYQNLSFSSKGVSLKKYKEPVSIQKKRASICMPTAEDIVSVTYKIDVSSFSPRRKLKLDFYLSYFCRMNFGRTTSLCETLNQDQIIVDSIYFDSMLIEDTFLLSFRANVKDEKRYVDAICKQIENPSFREDLFQIYKRDSMLEIASRCENVENIILPFVENIFTLGYEKEDTVKEVKNYCFEDFCKEIQSLSFQDCAICKIAKQG